MKDILSIILLLILFVFLLILGIAIWGAIIYGVSWAFGLNFTFWQIVILAIAAMAISSILK